ncbi:MAG: tyrosine-type recombinase/integrase [Bacteroidales bacterium]|nr:tyrosine-type recombinase/integrase [Bacteroidales bacterium]
MVAKRQLLKRRLDNEEVTFNQLYEEFVFSKKGQVASATLEYYECNLKSFKDYLERNNIVYINQFNSKNMGQFIGILLDKYPNRTTINAYLRAVRALLYYGMKEKYLPKFEIHLVREPEKAVEIYSDNELSKLFKSPNLKKCSFSEYRNWVMVQYFAETGNRLNSVINLKVKDVDFEMRRVTVRTTKNNKVVYSPISNIMTKTIINYIYVWGLEKEDYLFPNSERKQLTKDGISKTIARYNRSRGVEKTSIHLIRHTMATNFIRDNGDISILQRLLSHSSIAVTNRYVNFSSQDLVREIDKHSLVERLRRPKLIRK